MITESAIRAASILVVDDREANVLLLEGMLRRAGYVAVSRTTDPRQVCALHQKHRYDLILLDLQMPEMDGFQVMEALRAIEEDGYLPVLVITAQPAHKLRALQAGARDFVSKPFDLAEVLMRVSNLLETRLAQAKLRSYNKALEVRNELICKAFGRYLSDEVVKSLLESPETLHLGGETRRVTMMMADLRGFTAISERLAPGELVSVINNYLEKMIEVVTAHQGTIDAFTGDGILGIFGAPVTRDDDARRAVACAVAMQLAMVEVNRSNLEMGLPSLEMGIGINTGDVVVGNIGSMQRAKYGVLGSAVNVTSRIESYTTGGQIMISQSTFELVADYADIEPEGLVEPKGVSLPIPIHSVLGIRGRPDLTLLPASAELTPPAVPLSVRFAVLEGKDASGEVVEGRVTLLSRQSAEIEAIAGVKALSNLKLQLILGDLEPTGDVYAKVTDEVAPLVFRVRFTSIPPAVASFIDSALGPSTARRSSVPSGP